MESGTRCSQVKVVRPGNDILYLRIGPNSGIIVVGTVPILLQCYKFFCHSGECFYGLPIVR